MEIYRVDHISQVVPDLDKQVGMMEGLFGYQRLQSFENPDEGSKGVRFAVPGSWGQHWEVLAPANDDSPLATWIEENGGRPGLHHVSVEVPDLEKVTGELEDKGIKATGGVPGKWLEASLSPPDKGTGVLFRIRGVGDHPMCGYDPRKGIETPTSSDAPNLGIVAIDHVCQAWWDRDELARWYEDLAGFVQVWRTPTEEHPDMADLVMNIPGSAICWEIIMPRGEESFIDKFLDRSGPIAHHVTLEVADWDAAMTALDHHGIEPFGSNDGETDGAKWRDTFIHPKQTGGVLVQLFWEERPGVWVRSDKIPPQR